MNISKTVEQLQPLPMNYYRMSFVSNNRDERIRIQYYFNKKNGYFYGRLTFGKLAQGPPEHAHGGAITAVLDEAMGGAAWLNNIYAVTGELKVRFLKALKLGETVYVEAWVDMEEEKRAVIKGKICSADGLVYAESEGVFIRRSKEQFQAMGHVPNELFNVKMK